MTSAKSKPSEPAAPATAQPETTEAGESHTSLFGMASSLADAAGPVISAALTPVRSIASGANRIISDRPGARVRRVRRRAREPLPNLWDLHPQARRGVIRELGLQSVAVDAIRGTAVEGPPQRGGDFLPLRERRSDDWRGRWQRILAALERLQALPPVELIKFDDGYWVVDGHNRVAAALYNGQIEIDAVIEELRIPGAASESDELPPPIAGVLEGSLDLRAAGSGRLTRTAPHYDDLAAARRQRELEDELLDETVAGEAETGPDEGSPAT